MTHTTTSAFILLLLVLDPFGTLPVYLSVLAGVAPKRRVWVALRESFIAFLILLAFMLGGESFLRVISLLAITIRHCAYEFNSLRSSL